MFSNFNIKYSPVKLIYSSNIKQVDIKSNTELTLLIYDFLKNTIKKNYCNDPAKTELRITFSVDLPENFMKGILPLKTVMLIYVS